MEPWFRPHSVLTAKCVFFSYVWTVLCPKMKFHVLASLNCRYQCLSPESLCLMKDYSVEDIGWSTDLLSPEHKEQAWGYNIGETRIEQQSEMDCHGGKIWKEQGNVHSGVSLGKHWLANYLSYLSWSLACLKPGKRGGRLLSGPMSPSLPPYPLPSVSPMHQAMCCTVMSETQSLLFLKKNRTTHKKIVRTKHG